MSEAQSTVPALIPKEKLEAFNNTLPNLKMGQEFCNIHLNNITKVTTVEEREFAVSELTLVKKGHDKIRSLRDPYTKMLDDAKETIMQYERDSDYKSEKSIYAKKRKLIEEFDQAELERKQKEIAAAEIIKQAMLYKAELKEGVIRQLIDMVSGQKKTVIQSMAKWEQDLTLENIDAKEKGLSARAPFLKREIYEACFHMPVYPKKNILNEDAHKEYFEELKKELPYEKYNEEYVQLITPLINEYKSRIPEIKAQLNTLSAQAIEQRNKALQEEALAKVKQVDSAALEQIAEAKNETAMGAMEAEFVAQGMTQDIDTGAKERVAKFENNSWMKPFTEVVAHCATHPEFPGIIDSKGDYVKHVQWWLDFFSKKIRVEVKGIVITEKAKTTIRKK